MTRPWSDSEHTQSPWEGGRQTAAQEASSSQLGSGAKLTGPTEMAELEPTTSIKHSNLGSHDLKFERSSPNTSTNSSTI